MRRSKVQVGLIRFFLQKSKKKRELAREKWEGEERKDYLNHEANRGIGTGVVDEERLPFREGSFRKEGLEF